MKSLILNLVVCAVIRVLCGVLVPEGKMRKFVLNVVGIYLFAATIYPLINIISFC